MSSTDLIDQLRECANALTGDPGFLALGRAALLCRQAAEALGARSVNSTQELLDTIHDLRQQIAYHEAQDRLLSKAWEEAQRLRDELAEVKRPLDTQMARLNQNLVEANGRIAEFKKAVTGLLPYAEQIITQDLSDGAVGMAEELEILAHAKALIV